MKGITYCPKCAAPTHATESDDLGQCAECRSPAKRGRPKGSTLRRESDAVVAAAVARDMEAAKVDPRPWLGEANYLRLVRENKASEALANAASVVPVANIGAPYRQVLISALAAAAQHAKAYHEGMTDKRRKALQDITDAEANLAQARRDLLAAEAEDFAFPEFATS